MKPPRNASLRRLLREAGWTMEQLARSVNALGYLEGKPLRYDRTSVAHWLAGTRPRDPAPRLIAAALGDRLERRLTPEDIGLQPGRPTPADPLAALLDVCRTTSSGQHDPTGPGTPSPRGQRRRPTTDGYAADAAGPPQTPQSDIASFFLQLHYRYGSHGHHALATYIAHDLNPHRTNPNLLDYAKLSYVLGLLVADSGRGPMAGTLMSQAVKLAADARDDALQSIALRALSVQAHRAREFATALELVERARRIAPPGPVTSYALVLKAVLLAKAEERREALSALDLALRTYGPPSDRHDPFAAYPMSGLLYQEAQVLAACGQTTGAVRRLRSSLEERPEDELRGRALTHAALAHHLMPLSLSAAAAHIDEFCLLHPQLHSRSADAAARALRHRLAALPATCLTTRAQRRLGALPSLSPGRQERGAGVEVEARGRP